MTLYTVYMEDGGNGTDPESGTAGLGYDSFADFHANVVADTALSDKNLTASGHAIICYVRDMCTVTSQQTLGNTWTVGDPRGSEPGDAGTLWFVAMSGARALVDASPAGITTTSDIDLLVPYNSGSENRFGFKWLRFEHAGTNTAGGYEVVRCSTGAQHCFRYCHIDGAVAGNHGIELIGEAAGDCVLQGCIIEENGLESPTLNTSQYVHFTHCNIAYRISDTTDTSTIIESSLYLHEYDKLTAFDNYIHQDTPASATLDVLNSVFYDPIDTTASDANYTIDTNTNSDFSVDMRADGWFTAGGSQDYTLTASMPSVHRTRGAANTATYVLSEDAVGNAIGATNSTPGAYQYIAAPGAGTRNPLAGPFSFRSPLG